MNTPITEFGHEKFKRSDMYSYLKGSIILIGIFFQSVSHAHQIHFRDSEEVDTNLPKTIVVALEKNCRGIGKSELELFEALAKNYCDYENRWCENKGFYIFDTKEGQTIVVQYTGHWGSYEINHLLSNTDAIFCKNSGE